MRLLRYGLVGLASNLAGYLVYLAITALGAPPKATMTVLYGVGAATGYLGHRRWTFENGGSMTRSLPRYLLAHAVGYGLNWTLLHVFHDRLGYPHQAVQAVAIVVVAGVLYLLMGRFVFDPATRVAR
ncbi:MAG: GtrA family protein [Burkholderiales bacterium]